MWNWWRRRIYRNAPIMYTFPFQIPPADLSGQYRLVQRSPTDGPRENLVVRGEIWALLAIFMFIILFHYIIILFKTSSNKYHTNNFVIIKQVHFILIKLNFYDHYFIDVCTLLK
jgi:hypothetical protein